MRVSVLGFVRASVRNKHGFHAFLTRGMAKIQVIMALTLDGFLPHEDEMLMRWVRENKRYGFPRWQRQATFHIYPHYGLMDLLNVKEKHDKDCIYLAGVGDGGSAEYADGLFRYNLVDETVLFLLPLSPEIQKGRARPPPSIGHQPEIVPYIPSRSENSIFRSGIQPAAGYRRVRRESILFH